MIPTVAVIPSINSYPMARGCGKKWQARALCCLRTVQVRAAIAPPSVRASS